MTAPDPRLIPAALSLPLDARRALVARGGPGWWHSPSGTQWVRTLAREAAGRGHVDVFDHPGDIGDAEAWLRVGWVWWPVSEVAWMEAVKQPRQRYRIMSAGAELCGSVRFPRGISAPTAPECALRAWGVL